jgi:hypothetical protein
MSGAGKTMTLEKFSGLSEDRKIDLMIFAKFDAFGKWCRKSFFICGGILLFANIFHWVIVPALTIGASQQNFEKFAYFLVLVFLGVVFAYMGWLWVRNMIICGIIRAFFDSEGVEITGCEDIFAVAAKQRNARELFESCGVELR